MTTTTTQAPNPLQLGEVLYEILDATVIAVPNGGSSPQYNRVGFTTGGGTVLQQASLPPSSPILDVCACPDPLTGTMPVFLLTAESIAMIGSAGAAAIASWPVSIAGCSRIVGIDPTQPQQRTLLLLGSDGTGGAFLLPLICMPTQEPSATAIPIDTVAGKVQAGLMARQQLSARVVVASIDGSQLLVYDLGSNALGPTPTPPVSGSPVVLGQTNGDAVAMTAGSFLPGPDQQIGVAFVGASGELEVRVLGWDAQGQFTILTTWSQSATAAPSSGPALSHLAMENAIVRVAAGDLTAAGTDQLIIGYPATFQGTAGCAALLLFEMEGTTLTFSSSTAVASGSNPPEAFASIDLHLAAGLFGNALAGDSTSANADGVLGVVIIGCGASATQLFQGKAVVTAGLVPVDPNTSAFPPVSTAPGTPEFLMTIMEVAGDTSSVIALPSDVTGQSVILGPPTLSQTEAAGQLLAIVQVPPYETSIAEVQPSLTLSKTTSQVNGCNVSSNRTWMFSNDTGGSIGIGPLTLGRTLTSSYGNGFTNVTDNSTTTTMQISSTISEDDLMVLYATTYDVWVYPVYRTSVQSTPNGTVAVVFPQTALPIQTIIPASDSSIGYKPASQVGTLLTYFQAPKDGYTGQNLLFELIDFSVTDEKVGTTVTYDQTVMNSHNISTDYTVHNSASDSAHFSFSKTLLDYVPVNFGLNMSNGSSYSDNDVTTTSITYTTALTITISSGSVHDIQYAYQVTPYIYQHSTMGCLMVTYDVALTGEGWAGYYEKNVMPVMLVALMPNSSNPTVAGFTRDISFADQPDGSVDVTVSIFNDSQQTVENVTCELYLGAPVVNASQKLQPPSATPAGTQTVAGIDPAQRGTVTFNTTLAASSEVTVLIYARGLTPLARVYWGIYPPAAYDEYALVHGLSAR